MKFNDNSTILVHPMGTNVAIGIEGKNPKDVFLMFANMGATTGELIQDTDNFGYFWTTPERLNKTVKMIMVNRLLNKGWGERYKGKKDGFIQTVNKMVVDFFNRVKHETFVPKEAILYHYTLADLASNNREYNNETGE